MKLRVVTFSSSSPTPSGPHWSLNTVVNWAPQDNQEVHEAKCVLCRVQVPGERGCPITYTWGGRTDFSSLTSTTSPEPSAPVGHLTLQLGRSWWMVKYCRGQRQEEASCRTQECSEKGACFPQGCGGASEGQLIFSGTGIAHSPSWLQGTAPGSLLLTELWDCWVVSGTDASRFIPHCCANLGMWHVLLCWAFNPDTKDTLGFFLVFCLFIRILQTSVFSFLTKQRKAKLKTFQWHRLIYPDVLLAWCINTGIWTNFFHV